MKTIYSRRLTAALVTGALALGGALVATAPAHADVTLGGTVIDAGAGVDNAYVYAYQLDHGVWDSNYYLNSTDATGAWSTTVNLPDGTYALWYDLNSSTALYSLNQAANGAEDVAKAAASFTVTGGVASATTFPQTLTRTAGAVSVRIIDAVTSAPFANSAGSYASVSSGADPAGDYVYGNSTTGTTDATGHLVVGHVQVGTYTNVYGYTGGTDSAYVHISTAVSAGQTSATDLPVYTAGLDLYGAFGDPRAWTIQGTPKVGSLLTAAAAALPVPGAAVSYQWFSDSTVILGATAPTYVPTAKDLGTSVYYRAYYTAPGYNSDYYSSDDSDTVTIGDPNAPVVKISGAVTFGKKVKASVSTPTVAGAVYTYRWYRNGAPIAGADGSSYTITKSDVGKRIRVGVSSFAQGHTDAVTPSAETYAKDVTKLTVKPAKKTITTKTKLKVKVSLSKGDSKVTATGKAKVYYSKTKYKSVSLKGTKARTVTLPKLKKGTYTIKVVLESNSYKASTKTFKLKVTK